VGQNLGFDVNIMGAELHRMGIDSPMASMPVLDTCTEVTAKLLHYPVDVEGSLSFLRELHEYLFNKPFQKRTMPLPMWRQHVAF
jgi:DNA polymerase-3 subunit alpha